MARAHGELWKYLIVLTEAKKVLDKFYKVLPFLQEIKTDIIEKLEGVGHIKAIDKRILTIRSASFKFKCFDPKLWGYTYEKSINNTLE